MSARALKTLLAVFGVAAAAAPAAAADGLPVPVEQTFQEGVVSADGSTRFVTMPVGGQTLVMAISIDGGEITGYTIRTGNFTVPAVAVDGTASGVSGDGETLALIKPRRTFPRTSTEFLVYQAEHLRRDFQRFELEGDFSFDALSPDGETMYLIEYTDPKDPDSYQVRSMDLTTGKLDPDPILDSEEDPDDMRGLPQTRVTSPDGRWEYTLYDGGGGEPFVHALDVIDGVTVCIDLHMMGSGKTSGAAMAIADRGEVELTDRRGELRAIIDPETFEASEPGETAEEEDEADDGSGVPTGLVAGGVVLLGLGGIVLFRRRE